jgi:hypothetical protein
MAIQLSSDYYYTADLRANSNNHLYHITYADSNRHKHDDTYADSNRHKHDDTYADHDGTILSAVRSASLAVSIADSSAL